MSCLQFGPFKVKHRDNGAININAKQRKDLKQGNFLTHILATVLVIRFCGLCCIGKNCE